MSTIKPSDEQMAEAHHRFRLSPNTPGGLVVKTKYRRSKPVGEIAGSIGSHGYYQIRVLGRTLLNHHIVYYLNSGFWPTAIIDHRNGDKLDNSPKNLRQVGHGFNARAYRKSSGISGYLGVGVSISPVTGKRAFKPQVFDPYTGKSVTLGTFTDEDDAGRAYDIGCFISNYYDIERLNLNRFIPHGIVLEFLNENAVQKMDDLKALFLEKPESVNPAAYQMAVETVLDIHHNPQSIE